MIPITERYIQMGTDKSPALTNQDTESLAKIFVLQNGIPDLPPVTLEYEHYFANGCYVRSCKAPAGTVIVGEYHKTEHISILLKGCISFMDSNGTETCLEAPYITVSKPGKKAVLCHTDMIFLNVHPCTGTDLDQIKKEVIMDDTEVQLRLAEELTLGIQEGA